MKFTYTMPTEIYFGENAVKEYGNILRLLGKKAYIITGRSSSRNGSLEDMIDLLKKLKMDFKISNEMEENPSFTLVEKLSNKIKEFSPEFLVGIGGGSVIDTTKAVAVLCVNDLKVTDLYDSSKYSKALPIVAVPTTAGTGSEVTEYSVLTNDKTKMKKSFKSKLIFPRYSFLDPRYTLSMPLELTIATGLDALSHSLESILSIRSNGMSEIFALKANELIFENLPRVIRNPEDLTARKNMLFASMLAGVAIAQTGTTIIHGLGYPLTCFKGLKHGLANAILMVPVLRKIKFKEPKKVDKAIKPMENLEKFEEFLSGILTNLRLKFELEHSEITKWTEIGVNAKHIKTTPGNFGYEDIMDVYEMILDRYKHRMVV